MRQIGTISDGEQAERFADFLRSQGTACSLDSSNDGWAVWIQDEDRVASARKDLQTFLSNPTDERYRNARNLADAKLREEFQRRKAVRRNQISLRRQWDRPLAERCPLTIGLLLVCAVVAFFTRLGGQFVMPGEQPQDFLPLLKQLWISPTLQPGHQWDAIFSGEVWRIWTPMFIHYGWIHIIFNGLWLKDLGMMLESRLGSARFLVLVLVVGAVSNLLQLEMSALRFVDFRRLPDLQAWDLLPRNPAFGGMSGVVYGLFGYLWIRGKLDPQSGLGVSPQTVMWMLVWFVLCWTGYVGPIANWAHAGGLASGVALGALASMKRR
jgi:GlpG protein